MKGARLTVERKVGGEEVVVTAGAERVSACLSRVKGHNAPDTGQAVCPVNRQVASEGLAGLDR